jgi:uncharacterized protein (UPF0332 family)
MPSFADDLIGAARILLRREPLQRGRLSDARIRRAVSTAYYSLFHFLCDEATKRVAGSDNTLATRRRVLSRVLTHSGIRAAFDKIRGEDVDRSVADFLLGIQGAARPATPIFAREMARVFIDAKSKREDADYDRNKTLSEADATILISRIEGAVADWHLANSATDRDFKHALFILMLLKGKLRSEM